MLYLVLCTMHWSLFFSVILGLMLITIFVHSILLLRWDIACIIISRVCNIYLAVRLVHFITVLLNDKKTSLIERLTMILNFSLVAFIVWLSISNSLEISLQILYNICPVRVPIQKLFGILRYSITLILISWAGQTVLVSHHIRRYS